MPKRSDIPGNLMPPQEVISQIQRSSPVQDVFGWSVPVEEVPLPSEGAVYPPSSSLHGRKTLQIKAMTAQEEDILLSRALMKEGTIVSHLLKSCLIDKSVNPDDLLTGDRNSLLVAIRITGYGADYRSSVICPSCDRPNQSTFDLAGLEIKRLGDKPTRPGVNEFSFELPVTKKNVVFKLLTSSDEDEAKRVRERMRSLFPDAKVEPVVTKQLENQIISIDGKTDRAAISAFIKSMPAGDSRALRYHMISIEPGLKMQVNFACKFCGAESKVALPLGAEFFWPGQ